MSRKMSGRRAAQRVASSHLAVLFAAAMPLLAGVASLMAQPATAVSSRDSVRDAVHDRLAALLAEVPQGTTVGLVVANSADGATWFTQEASQPLKPASVMKLFTTTAALERFGPDFTYRTELYVHNDELLVIGSGDPGLGDERIAGRHDRPLHGEFDLWTKLLKQRGVTTLKTIVLDDAIFERKTRHEDWPPDENEAWYQAPVGGINFNDNCLDARVSVAGDAIELALQPPLPTSFFCNMLTLSSEHAPVVRRRLHEDVFQFSGTVARDDRLEPIAVGRPTVLFGHALRHALKMRGIPVTENVVRRTITPAALDEAELLTVHTTGLRDVLWRINTFSQNLFADCLLKSLAAYNPDGTRSGKPGSWAGGKEVLKATLQGLGLDLSAATLRDGSGLSHHNRLTAEQIAQLLLTVRRHRYGPLLIQTMAQPGEPGTMQRRYTTPVVRGHIRAKTGTLSGVRSLAGYASRGDGLTLVFALLINGEPPPDLPTRVAEVLVQAGIEK